MTDIIDQVKHDRQRKAELFQQQMERPPGDWWARLRCWFKGGHYESNARFTGQSPRHIVGVSGRLFYYGKCPRCAWHVYYDGDIDRWYDGIEAPDPALLAPQPQSPPRPPAIPPSWGY